MKKNNQEILDDLLSNGRIIKEGFSGVYFLVQDKKLFTSMEIHTSAGGNPDKFIAWQNSQNIVKD